MRSFVVKLRSPKQDGECSVCRDRYAELWYLNTETQEYICGKDCKYCLERADQMLKTLYCNPNLESGGWLWASPFERERQEKVTGSSGV